VNVHEINPGLLGCSGYTLNVSGLYCNTPGSGQCCTISPISVSQPTLWPPNHNLVNVGLAGGNLNSGCTSTRQVQVFGDEDDQTNTGDEVFSPDAKNINIGTLRLRSERVDSLDGRVYLIVAKTTGSFQCTTVVVPKSQSAANINSVNAQAAAAKNYCEFNGGAPPPGYFVIGDGPIIGNKQ